MINWKLESDVNNWVQKNLELLGLQKHIDFADESSMSDYMKESLQWWSKTKNKTNFWKPDFHLENYKIENQNIPVIIENKLFHKKLVSWNLENLKMDEKSISNFAVNGAIYYAQHMVASWKYKEVIAIWVAWDSEENVEIMAFYVFWNWIDGFKCLKNTKSFHFLETQNNFREFYREKCLLSENEKHEILVKSRKDLQDYAKKLNKLMHNHNITAWQRVLYVSGMLLAMQSLENENWDIILYGLSIDDLKWFWDGGKIISQIKLFLELRNIPDAKKNLMLASFSEISKDTERDNNTILQPEVSNMLPGLASTNKQIFTFIYNTIFSKIENFKRGYVDIMWEMYSEFLKYALWDWKEIWIVLTPPYVTKMMVQILDIKQDSRVMDLATWSAWFLISAMEEMIDSVEKEKWKYSQEAKYKIDKIKKEQLLWVELNAEMFTLAATNMILRWDWSSNIQKGNTFETPKSLYENFNADRILLNPPFSFKENWMPFIDFGLDNMQKWWFWAIIIQDSAWSWKATMSNKKILKNHTLVASIKMPTDLFQPMAWVQTSIYIFEAHKPHDFDKIVKFIDFRNDWYKRTSRSLQELDTPIERYEDIIKIYKAWKNAKNLKAKWDLDEIYIENQITDSGNDWNFDQHKKIDTTPTLWDFKKTVSDYLSWEVSQILQKNTEEDLGKA